MKHVSGCICSTVLASDVIAGMAQNCSSDNSQGDVVTWVEFDGHWENDVDKKFPSICGGSACPPGYEGSLCDIVIGECILQRQSVTLS